MPIQLFKATLLAGVSFVLVSCAAGNQALQSVGDSMSKAAAAIDESLKDDGAASASRSKNAFPAELGGILTPEKKTAGNYPRVALALSNFDKALWQGTQLQNPNGCMDVAATVWQSAASSKVTTFKFCSPENVAFNVPWKELDFYWFSYKTGAMATKAPRKDGSRLGPATPKTFWPNSPEDFEFLGVDYNGGTSVLDNSVTLGVASIVRYLDLDWEKRDDQRIWVSSIERSGYAPSSAFKTPDYKTP